MLSIQESDPGTEAPTTLACNSRMARVHRDPDLAHLQGSASMLRPQPSAPHRFEIQEQQLVYSLKNSAISERTEEQLPMTVERGMKTSTISSFMPATAINRKSIGTDSTVKEAMSESGGLLLGHKMSHHHSPQIQVVD